MKKCDKCDSKLENIEGMIGSQTITLFDQELDLCTDCAGEVCRLITGKIPGFLEDTN